MKGKRFSLNPYVPLSKWNAEKDSKNHDDEAHPQPQHLLQSKAKNMPQSLQNVSEWEVQQADLELGYLKSAFLDSAKQSLSDAYSANNSDLDNSIDLLHHFDDESSFLGDAFSALMIYESVPAADSASPNPNNTASKAGASSNLA
ncbi:hypothetical protein JHK82_014623 [Glycine max]|nr:hypothetical protein JHK85_014989 [Glycine max]KAG5045237.1 hypothetical protein JHK86_014643 [Glycine max]KAG5147742.1 hypothetical protein JHK82_014623 [Glycine max]